MRFCPNCGIPVGESPRYCAGCGTQVIPAQPVPSRVSPAPAERGPFDSAPLRLGTADAPRAGSVSVVESPPGEQAAAASGIPESWLPAELTTAGRTQTTGFGVRDPWPHHELGDPSAPGSRRRAAWSGHRMTITAMVVTVALVSPPLTWAMPSLGAGRLLRAEYGRGC